MCAYGPMVLGYGNREVEAAADAQRKLGDVLTGPSERLVELAEKLVGMVAHADWALFQRNGTDATTLCVVIARAATKKRKILVARGAYHGSAPWCTPHPTGTTAEDRVHLVHYEYNDVASLQAAALSAEGDIAGVIASAFKHDYGQDQQLPTPEFAQAVRALCDATGAALILDDVRAGFRMHLGGSWETVGVRPDLAAYSKAIANGYTLAAVTGSDKFRDAAASVFMTGSFWCGAASMAASLKTLEIFERDDTIAYIERIGQRFRDGLAAQASAHGQVLKQTGPAQMPTVLFADDPQVEKGRLFTAEALRGGAWLHPQHNMFLSAAHTEADIDRALQATELRAMAACARIFGRDDRSRTKKRAGPAVPMPAQFFGEALRSRP